MGRSDARGDPITEKGALGKFPQVGKVDPGQARNSTPKHATLHPMPKPRFAEARPRRYTKHGDRSPLVGKGYKRGCQEKNLS